MLQNSPIIMNRDSGSLGHADLDLKVLKLPCVKHGIVLSKYSHMINMGLL